jgi:hypothetical protein
MAPAPPRRKSLNDLLKELLGTDFVYFQPGPDVDMQYPCIVYERDNSSVQHADDLPYRSAQRYQVTYMDYNPDSDVVAKLLALPLCSFNRHYATSGLNHDVFMLYH